MNYEFVFLKLKYPTDIDGSTEDRRYFEYYFLNERLKNDILNVIYEDI